MLTAPSPNLTGTLLSVPDEVQGDHGALRSELSDAPSWLRRKSASGRNAAPLQRSCPRRRRAASCAMLLRAARFELNRRPRRCPSTRRRSRGPCPTERRRRSWRPRKTSRLPGRGRFTTWAYKVVGPGSRGQSPPPRLARSRDTVSSLSSGNSSTARGSSPLEGAERGADRRNTRRDRARVNSAPATDTGRR